MFQREKEKSCPTASRKMLSTFFIFQKVVSRSNKKRKEYFFDNITKQNHNNRNKENNNGRNITNNCKTTINFNFIIKSFFCVFELENGSEYIKENEEKFVSLEK